MNNRNSLFHKRGIIRVCVFKMIFRLISGLEILRWLSSGIFASHFFEAFPSMELDSCNLYPSAGQHWQIEPGMCVIYVLCICRHINKNLQRKRQDTCDAHKDMSTDWRAGRFQPKSGNVDGEETAYPNRTVFFSKKLDQKIHLLIWMFPKIGVPLVIILSNGIFPDKPSSY